MQVVRTFMSTAVFWFRSSHHFLTHIILAQLLSTIIPWKESRKKAVLVNRPMVDDSRRGNGVAQLCQRELRRRGYAKLLSRLPLGHVPCVSPGFPDAAHSQPSTFACLRRPDAI